MSKQARSETLNTLSSLDLYQLALNAADDELENLKRERRLLMERHQRELWPLEAKVMQVERRRRDVLAALQRQPESSL